MGDAGKIEDYKNDDVFSILKKVFRKNIKTSEVMKPLSGGVFLSLDPEMPPA